MKANAWDAYLVVMNKQQPDGQFVAGLDFSFFDYMSKGESVVPTWSMWSSQPVWPLSSTKGVSWCRDALTMHKPVRHFDGLLGTHADWPAAMAAFLDTPQCPDGLRCSVARARFAVEFGEVPDGTRKRGGFLQLHGKKKRKTETAEGADSDDDGAGSDAAIPGVGDEALFSHGPAVSQSDYVGAHIDERTPGSDLPAPWRCHLPDDDKLTDLKALLYRRLESDVSPLVCRDGTTGLWPDVFMANARQRVLLADVLWHLHDVAQHRASAGPSIPGPRLWGLVAGVAGTGKTFIQQFVKLFCSMFSFCSTSSVMVAPTGVAADNCGGSTPERALAMDGRSSKVLRGTKQLPLPTSKQQRVAQLQEQYQHVLALMCDEVSMYGRCFMGQVAAAASRCFGGGEVVDDEQPLWGGLGLVLFFGDFCQLQPVCEPDGVLYDRRPPRTVSGQHGLAAYQSLTSYYELDEPIRQDATSALYTELRNARHGVVTPSSVAFWNSRHKLHLPVSQRPSFTGLGDDRLLQLVCFDKQRAEINAEYVASLQSVCRVNAVCSGPHARNDKDGRLKAVPRMAAYAVGGMVKLTDNLCPEFGLANGSRGVVRDIIYPGGVGYVPPSSDTDPVFPMLIVEFPKYRGPPLLEDATSATAHPLLRFIDCTAHPHLVPIVPTTVRCERGCCTRVGLPLVCGKADTVHSAQGISIGPGKQLERCVFRYTPEAERFFPGIFYVGCSRVMDIECLAMDQPVTRSGAVKVGCGDRAQASRDEMGRIAVVAATQRESKQRDCPERTFEAGLRWFCALVKADVAQQMNGGGMMQDRDQLRDVVAVCDQWLAGLGPSSMGASLDAPLQVVQQPQSLGDDQVPGLDGLDSGLDMDAYDHKDGFLASNGDDSNDDDNGDAGSLGRAPLIRNDHLDPRGPAERQTSGDTGEGANHADHPFANGFPGATDGLDMDAYDHNDGFLASNSDDSNDDDNGDDSARREYELVMQSFRGSYTRRADARGSGIACDSSGDGGLDVSGGRDAGRSVDTDSADSDEGSDQTDSDGFDDFIDDGSDRNLRLASISRGPSE